MRDEPQFVEYGQQLVLDVHETAVGGVHAVHADRPHGGKVVQRNSVVHVLHIGQQADGGRGARLQLAHARFAQQELPREVLARTGHAQRPGQPLADCFSDLKERRE